MTGPTHPRDELGDLGDQDPRRAVQQRAARRALLRAHHPDLGGDPETFIAVLSALESPVSRAPSPSAATTTFTTSRARRRRTAVRRVRSRLPRRVPGARRFGTY